MSSVEEKSKSVKKSVKAESKKSSKNTVKKSSTKKSGTRVSEKKKVNKSDAVEEITLEEAESFYHISLLVQAVCSIGVLFVSVLTLFENSFTVPIEVLVGITLLVMAYNNVKLFKRKGFTIVYIVFGTISLIVGLLGYFGVTL